MTEPAIAPEKTKEENLSNPNENKGDAIAEYGAKIDAERAAAKAAADAGKNGGSGGPENLADAQKKITPKKDEEQKTPEQIAAEANKSESERKIADITAQKEAIEKDLKLTKEEKELAIQKLDSITKDKDWWEEPQSAGKNKGAPTDESKNKEIETKLKALEDKEAEYNEILNDELLKAIVAGKKAGKDPKAILNELRGSDVDSIPDAVLYEKKLRSTLRLTQEDKEEGKTIEDVIKEEMEEFKGFSRAKKARETDDVREALRKEDEQRFSKYASSNEQKVTQNTEWSKKAAASMGSFIESVKDKNYFGVQMTPSNIEKVNDMVKAGLRKGYFNEDGSYNPKFAFEQAAWAVPEVRNLIMENAKKKYLAQGKEEALLELQRADGNFRIDKTTPTKKELPKNATAAEIAAHSGFTP